MLFDEIYQQYVKIVFGYLITLTNYDYDIAEELTQETFFRAYNKINSFKGDSKLSTWLCQIAKYTFYQYLESNKSKKVVSLHEIDEMPSDKLLENEIIEKESLKEVVLAISELKEEVKLVLVMRLFDEMSFNDIGDYFGKSENWARVTFYRGKLKVKEWLDEKRN